MLPVLVAVFGCSHHAQPQPAPSQSTRDAEQFKLRALLTYDPVNTLIELGVKPEEFEPIAKRMYLYWREHFPAEAARIEKPRVVSAPVCPPAPRCPEPFVTISPVQPASPPPPTTIEDREANTQWWCYTTSDGETDRCDETREACQGLRKRLVGPLPPPLCVPGEPEDVCVEKQVDHAAYLQGVSACTHHDHAGCFLRHSNLANDDEFFCSPTLRACKNVRAIVAKKFTDDWKIKSDCIAK